MTSNLKNLSDHDAHSLPDGSRMRIVVIKAAWNNNITDKLKDSCVKTLSDAGVKSKNIIQLEVPGSFELISAASISYNQIKPDAVICIGCVIKGETPHFDFISSAVANGIADLNIKHDVPFIFGVLTTNNLEQAEERAGGKHGNKGIEAAAAALKMIALKRKLTSKKK